MNRFVVAGADVFVFGLSGPRLHTGSPGSSDIKRESMGPDRDQDTVQAKSAERLIGLKDWDVVLNDDDTGEVADLVALKREDLGSCAVWCTWGRQRLKNARR